MVIYKPNVRYLLQVLEYAAEDFGGSLATQITNVSNTSSSMPAPAAGQLPGLNTTAGTNATAATVTLTTATNTTNLLPSGTTHSGPLPPPATNPAVPLAPPTQSITVVATSPTSLPPTPTLPIDPFALHVQLTQILHANIQSYTQALLSSSSHSSRLTAFSPAQIIALENAFCPPHALDWTDGSIDYAYAYEGVIIPGGKIMMGRWWRCHGVFGAGEGSEIDSLGRGVEMADGEVGAEEELGDDSDAMEGLEGSNLNGNGEGDEAGGNGTGTSAETTPRRNRALERGPFVFWC